MIRPTGYPKSCPHDDLLKIVHCPSGQTYPTPKSVDFKPDAVLGSVGLRTYLGSPATLSSSLSIRGAEFPLRVELPDAVISEPFWPAYLTAGRIAKAKRLKLAIAAGLGSNHVDLQDAIDHKITVAEVTYSNSISLSEHVVRHCHIGPVKALLGNFSPTA
jgi:formate dehydrogenase